MSAQAPPQFPPPIDPDDPGRGPLIMGLAYSFTILAVMVVAMRFYVRRKMANRTWGWDDWLMLMAVVFQVVCECVFTVCFKRGFGKHDHSVRMPDQFVEIMKWAWIAQGFGQVTSILARISIAISLVGLFGVHRWFKWFLVVLATLQLTLGIGMLVLSYTQARPIEALWNVFMTDPTTVWRLDTKIFVDLGYLTQSIYTFADVTYVLIPVAIIWRLNMALHRRLGLIALLTGMLFTATMSILKTYTIHWQGDPSVVDPLYRNSLQVLYANMEQTSVIIMGCVPSLRAMAKINLPFGLSSVGQSVASLLTGRRRGGSSSNSNSNSTWPRKDTAGRSGGGTSFPSRKFKSFGLSFTAEATRLDDDHQDLELGKTYRKDKLGIPSWDPVVVPVGKNTTSATTTITTGPPSKLPTAGGTTTTTTTTGANSGVKQSDSSTENLVPRGGADNQVWRTDQFTIEECYNGQVRPGK